MHTQIKKLQSLLLASSRIVFFGGAGVSTESGIPDFRSQDGLYNQQWDEPPETMLSLSYFLEKPEKFYAFYRAKILCPDAQPNAAHRALHKLEAEGKLTAVVTQNIDGLHQKAGSKQVLELHGSIWRNHCMACHAFYALEDIVASHGVPHCTCGGIIKPDVVLYEESLNPHIMQQAIMHIDASDMLIIGGTSLQVYPAAGFVQGYRGTLVIINRSPTLMDSRADLVIKDNIGETLQKALSQ